MQNTSLRSEYHSRSGKYATPAYGYRGVVLVHQVSDLCARDLVVVIVAQKVKICVYLDACFGGGAGNSRVPHLPARICYRGFSVGRGVDPAGNAPEGG
ncbi:Molybdopterin biosynthesis protein (ISS) [Dorcoceras hygrometricum]|uniref:Molybdopterin biosynthesis protein (ISS) n=1 Tax=Dorcoceras hygrometricum TaxID=472368 RepID=A0A2Z7C715_9LAMI|nr:Molybdopterin biosynthesis protein (ISS) [Dorcoceras hygrometricum]